MATVSLDFVRHDTTRTCTAIGERGSLRWNAIAGAVQLFEPGDTGWRTVFEDRPHRDASYLEEWRHFMRCIDDRITPLVSGEDGLAVLRIVEAARTSAARGAIVHLSPA
jgi:predicted dehydrogenase